MHRAIFPEFHLADDATSMRHFGTTAGGSMPWGGVGQLPGGERTC